MVAGDTGYRKMLAPCVDFLVYFYPSDYKAWFREDNQAMMQVVRTGRNPTMRYLSRVHRVSVADLHERLGHPQTKDKVDMVYTRSDSMSADIYTKGFTDKDKWIHACELVNITSPGHLKDMIQNSAERFRNMLDPAKPAPSIGSKSTSKKTKCDKQSETQHHGSDDVVMVDSSKDDGVSINTTTDAVCSHAEGRDKVEADKTVESSQSASKSRRRR